MTIPFDHHLRDPLPKLARRLFPLLVAVTILIVLLFSAVPPNLVYVTGAPAETIMVVYALLLVGISSEQLDNGLLHQIGVPLAVLTFGARGGGFIELSIDRGTWELAGAVAERVLIASALVLWHVSVGTRISVERELADWTDE